MVVDVSLCPGTVSIPLYYGYGDYPRIQTNITWGTPPQAAIPTIFDTGSAGHWVYGPNATINSGSPYLFVPGPCNQQPRPYFDWPKSTTHQGPRAQRFSYAYGGNGKIVDASYSINDTMGFENTAYPPISGEEVAVANYTILKQRATTCDGADYDKSILGLFHTTSDGPSLRANLFNAGKVRANVFSMWMDRGPADIEAPFLGQSLLGCVAKGKYAGNLLSLKQTPPEGSIGYYIAPPASAKAAPVARPAASKTLPLASGVSASACLVDSGSGTVQLPYDQDTFLNITGLVDRGYPAFKGRCNDIPHDANLELEFKDDAGKTVSIKTPLRGFARFGDSQDGTCSLALELGLSTCILGAPFFTGAFVAYDDDKKTVALAQGGVTSGAAKPGPLECM